MGAAAMVTRGCAKIRRSADAAVVYLVLFWMEGDKLPPTLSLKFANALDPVHWNPSFGILPRIRVYMAACTCKVEYQSN